MNPLDIDGGEHMSLLLGIGPLKRRHCLHFDFTENKKTTYWWVSFKSTYLLLIMNKMRQISTMLTVKIFICCNLSPPLLIPAPQTPS